MEPYAGRGTAHISIAQWDYKTRWPRLVRYASQRSENPWGRWFQITYVLIEMKAHYRSVYQVLNNPQVTLVRATTVVNNRFEVAGPKDAWHKNHVRERGA